MTDSNRLKIIHPNLLSSQVHCLKFQHNSSKVTLPVCFYCFTHKSKLSSCIVKVLQGEFSSFSGLGFTLKAQVWSQNSLTVYHRMSESSCCIWTVTQKSLYRCFCWENCGIFTLHRLSSIIQNLLTQTACQHICSCVCASVTTFRQIMKSRL